MAGKSSCKDFMRNKNTSQQATYILHEHTYTFFDISQYKSDCKDTHKHLQARKLKQSLFPILCAYINICKWIPTIDVYLR